MEKTYVQAYGVHQGFIGRSELVKKNWLEDADGENIQIEGSWKNSGMFSTDENYFIITGIVGESVSGAAVIPRLEELVREIITRKYGDAYAQNLSWFACEKSIGYEYPILTPEEVQAIVPMPDSLSAAATLRYAYASNFAYTLEEENPALLADPIFQKLMIAPGATSVDVVKAIRGTNDIYACALKVPAVDGLPEEIIIAYKGTKFTNLDDVWRDIQIGFENLIASTKWDEHCYAFLESVLKDYAPNAASFAPGYQGTPQGSYNVVLTGHSLGAYSASSMGIRTGINTRIFSSPATKIVESFPKFFGNTLWMRNVMNFFRKTDPVVNTGRHDENRLSMKAAWNPLSSHSLDGIIQDILIPWYKGEQPLDPTGAWIQPNITTGAGISHRINEWT